MSIADYRRQIEAEIARERERAAQPVLDAAAGDVEALGALAASGIPHQSDVERAQAALDAPDALPELRAAALRIVTDAHPDPATAHEAALQRVTDASQPPEVRMAALQVLKVQAIASPSFPEWRPDYLQAMRTASRDEVPAIRRAALEVLATYKDPYAAEVLLAGLREPARALVLPEEALQLLGYDIHEEAYEIAEQIAADPPSPQARHEALHLLATNAAYADRFEALYADAAEELRARRLAATALSAIDPDRLRSAAEELFPGIGGDVPAGPADAVADDETEALRRHTAALLNP